MNKNLIRDLEQFAEYLKPIWEIHNLIHSDYSKTMEEFARWDMQRIKSVNDYWMLRNVTN